VASLTLRICAWGRPQALQQIGRLIGLDTSGGNVNRQGNRPSATFFPCQVRCRPRSLPSPGMSDASIVYIVLAVLVILFVWNKVPVEIVALAAPLTLFATGVIAVEEAFAGFGDTTVIFIACLFI